MSLRAKKLSEGVTFFSIWRLTVITEEVFGRILKVDEFPIRAETVPGDGFEFAVRKSFFHGSQAMVLVFKYFTESLYFAFRCGLQNKYQAARRNDAFRFRQRSQVIRVMVE